MVTMEFPAFGRRIRCPSSRTISPNVLCCPVPRDFADGSTAATQTQPIDLVPLYVLRAQGQRLGIDLEMRQGAVLGQRDRVRIVGAEEAHQPTGRTAHQVFDASASGPLVDVGVTGQHEVDSVPLEQRYVFFAQLARSTDRYEPRVGKRARERRVVGQHDTPTPIRVRRRSQAGQRALEPDELGGVGGRVLDMSAIRRDRRPPWKASSSRWAIRISSVLREARVSVPSATHPSGRKVIASVSCERGTHSSGVESPARGGLEGSSG